MLCLKYVLKRQFTLLEHVKHGIFFVVFVHVFSYVSFRFREPLLKQFKRTLNGIVMLCRLQFKTLKLNRHLFPIVVETLDLVMKFVENWSQVHLIGCVVRSLN